jgi:hypothetical protein
MRGEAVAGEMPRLDAFDEEFGREPVAILRGQQRRRLRLRVVVGLLLAAAIATVLVVAWSIADEWQRPQAPLATASVPDEEVVRLVREVATLKQEIRQLTAAQQQATETIAALEAEQDNRLRASFWYSETAALTFGIGGQSEPGATTAAARRAAAARPKPRRREEPLSIEPPQ